MGSLNCTIQSLSMGALEEITDLLSSKFPGSQVAHACQATAVALFEFSACASELPYSGGNHTRETEPARLRFEGALLQAKREPLVSEADILPKCLLYRHLVEWVGEEDRRVQSFGAEVLNQITILLMGETDRAISSFSKDHLNGSNNSFGDSSTSE